MITTTQCPADDILRRYAIGDYTDEEGDTIEAHLSECVVCEDILAQFDETSDSLVRHLPLTGHEDRKDESSGWLQRLMSGPNHVGRTAANIDQESSIIDEPQGNFGAYELCGILGQGGMGVVYEARHRQLGKPVAIKVVSPKLIAAHDAQRRFDREIQVLGALRHPGIVSATDAGRISGAAYLVMERIDGIDLARLVRRAGPLSIPEACEIGRQIALALAAAHEAQAIHRDVKPSNVMIDREGQVKLLDFGLAHLADSMGSRQETSLGRLLGTLNYMAPEQAEGKPVSPSVDLYALGATLFFLLTGRPPKSGDREQTLFAQIRAVTESTAPRLNEIRSDVPEALSDLVASLLENDPEQRLSSAVEAATALEQLTNADSAALNQLVESAEISPSRQADRDAVVQSLSELLGNESAEVLPTVTEPERSRGGGLWKIATAFAGLGALIALGIMLIIQTEEGTIQIESEVAGVTVEFLDEEERVEKLQLESKAGETQLKAGKYRVRLAGGHDRLTVEPDVIVLTKNETEVARVSMRKNEPSVAKIAPQEGGVTALYRGETEAVWQKRFQAETDPLAKIEAGTALIKLSESLSTEDRIERFVEIGGALVQSGWGDDADDYFSYSSHTGRSERLSPQRWSTASYPELDKTWSKFTDVAVTTCEGLDFSAVVRTLVATTQNSSAAEAIFAAELLNGLAGEISHQEPSAAVSVLELRIDDESPVLKLHLSLIQTDYFQFAPRSAQEKFVGYYTSVGEALIAEDSTDESYRAYLEVREWFQRCLDHEIPVPTDLKARVAQNMLLAKPHDTLEDIFQTRWLDDGSLPYPEEWMKSAREARYAIWDAWLPYLDEWLKSHPEQNEESRLMLSTLNVALRLYQQTDDWPIDSIAEQLTQRAERHAPHQAGTSLHDLLSYIILADGEPPPQSRKLFDADVSKFPPPVREIVQLLSDEKGWDSEKLKRYEGVLLEHPVATVAVLTRVASGPEFRFGWTAIREMLIPLSASRGQDSPPPMEPLLLLAILTKLTGESEAQDERIAELFAEQQPGRVFARHVEDAVFYPYGLRKVTLKWLRRMRERSVSEPLIAELDKLLLGDVRDRAEFIENYPHSLVAVLKLYNEKTRNERTTLFDPPIPELNINRLTEAFRSAAKKYRKLGNNALADALQETAETGELAEGLEMFGVTGTNQTRQGELSFRQFLPGLTFDTGPKSRQMVYLSDVELRYSRDGWSSPDWGKVDAPLTGEWKLKSVTADGEELDEETLKQWLDEYKAWSRIVIEDNRKFTLAGALPETSFDLELAYNTPATFELSRQGEAEYRGLFMSNASIDNTELRFTLDMNGGPPPKSYRTEGKEAVTLDYRRAESSEASGSNKNQMPPEGEEPNDTKQLETSSGDNERTPKYPPSPEFPPVRVSIVSEDGKPLEGAQITMRQLTSDRRSVKIEVEDVSGDDGLAIERVLPHGDYYTTVKTAEGWQESFKNIHVEFAKGLDLTIVAPSPGRSAKFEVKSAVDFSTLNALEELRFGILEHHASSRSQGWSPQQTPEPDSDLGQYATFPSLANGIDEIAVGIRLILQRDLPHPMPTTEQTTAQWKWTPDDVPMRNLMIFDGAAYAIEDVDALHLRPDENSDFFKLKSDRYKIGAVRYQLGKPQSFPMTLDVPVGELTVLLVGFRGRPSKQVVESLILDKQANDSSEIWLVENVTEDSKWIQRIPGTQGWSYGKHKDGIYYGHIARQERSLKPSDKMSVSFGAAQPSVEATAPIAK